MDNNLPFNLKDYKMAFSLEHIELMKSTRVYLKESGIPIDKYTFVNYGDDDLWIYTYDEFDHYFTSDIKNKFIELGIKYNSKPSPINNN